MAAGSAGLVAPGHARIDAGTQRPDVPIGILTAAPVGAMVLAAHVDSVTDGVGPFAELLSTRRGDKIRVAGSGATQLFRVTSVPLKPRTSLAEGASIFSVQGPLRLVLISCAGPFDADGGGYRDNLIVQASPVGRPRPLDG